ncbi:MAG TPA: hypothetical protein VM677_34245 [Actinokineospora sp.]|nr:hypothetical protein [Actinokineospora sp.]
MAALQVPAVLLPHTITVRRYLGTGPYGDRDAEPVTVRRTFVEDRRRLVRALMAWFLGAYAARGGKNLGIYNCRNVAGSSTSSPHGEGRAADLGVPVGGRDPLVLGSGLAKPPDAR